jgi:hypothetical protein
MDLNVDLTAITIVSIVFMTSAIIVATVFLFIHKARELRHATIRLALEKGQPLPPDLLDGGRQDGRPRSPSSDLNSGVKAFFIGIGLSLFFYFFHQRLWPVGLIPMFVGIGHLAAHALTGRSTPSPPPAV